MSVQTDPPGGVCIGTGVEFERRARRGRSRVGDFASGGLRSNFIFDTEYIDQWSLKKQTANTNTKRETEMKGNDDRETAFFSF